MNLEDIEIIDKIVCGWEEAYSNEMARLENLFKSIVSDWTYEMIFFSEKFISSLETLKWEEWHKEFLEDEKRHKENGLYFNIFDLLRDKCGFQTHEKTHSQLIKFLLDSTASHGQGKNFLVEFLKLLGICAPKDGIWNISAEQGYIDILLYRTEPESIIVIENKSNDAPDQPNQLYRYWHHKIYRRTERKDKEFYDANKDKYRIIYLSKNEDKKYEKKSISKPKDNSNGYFGNTDRYNSLPNEIPMGIDTLYFTDGLFLEWLDNCIQSLDTNHRIREYIAQYKMLCKSL